MILLAPSAYEISLFMCATYIPWSNSVSYHNFKKWMQIWFRLYQEFLYSVVVCINHGVVYFLILWTVNLMLGTVQCRPLKHWFSFVSLHLILFLFWCGLYQKTCFNPYGSRLPVWILYLRFFQSIGHMQRSLICSPQFCNFMIAYSSYRDSIALHDWIF